MAGLTQILVPGMALAAEGSGAADYFIACVVTAGFSLGIAAGLAALSQAKAIYAACEGIARQPNASGKLTTTLVIGLAFIESLAIYVLVIGLILFFANPFQDLF
ncbi:ATP synthase F0 subunit C [bacterium]|nr:ATP synthase F0 subunit C [bacterium]